MDTWVDIDVCGRSGIQNHTQMKLGKRDLATK